MEMMFVDHLGGGKAGLGGGPTLRCPAAKLLSRPALLGWPVDDARVDETESH